METWTTPGRPPETDKLVNESINERQEAHGISAASADIHSSRRRICQHNSY